MNGSEVLESSSRPSTPTTTLWFEFLLDPSLLQQHFVSENPGQFRDAEFCTIGIVMLLWHLLLGLAHVALAVLVWPSNSSLVYPT